MKNLHTAHSKREAPASAVDRRLYVKTSNYLGRNFTDGGHKIYEKLSKEIYDYLSSHVIFQIERMRIRGEYGD